MEFKNDFTVPVALAQAWSALMDMDQVARCMPGATLIENSGDRFSGKVKVKVGPITVTYQGVAEFVERDEAAGRAVLSAKGREERGAGTAAMTVTMQLEQVGEAETLVKVLTDLDITGKPAQFGRGVMAEVGTAIIGKFATNLSNQLSPTTEPQGGKQAADESSSPASAEGAMLSADPPAPSQALDDPDSLDLGSLIWGPAAKRALPVLAGAAVGLILGGAMLRKDSTPDVVVMFVKPEQS